MHSPVTGRLRPFAAMIFAKPVAWPWLAALPRPVGVLPKIDGLTATQGDSAGEIELSWNPIKRGLQNYLIELTDDAAGPGPASEPATKVAP